MFAREGYIACESFSMRLWHMLPILISEGFSQTEVNEIDLRTSKVEIVSRP